MEINAYYIAAALGTLLTAVAQMLLKTSALRMEREGTTVRAFFKPYSVAGYAVFVVVTVLNLYALKGIRLIDMVYFLPFTFIFVFLISYFVFKEKLDMRRVMGIVLILAGTILFNI